MKLDELRQLVGSSPWQQGEEQQRATMARLQEQGIQWANLYQELEMSSRYVDSHRDTSYRPSGGDALHSHQFYELLYCESNSGAEYLLGSQRYRLRRGDVVFVPPGVGHRPILPHAPAEPYRRVVLWVSHELMDRVWAASDDGLGRDAPFLLRTSDVPGETVGELFHTGVHEADVRAPGWEWALVGNTIALLVQLRRLLARQEADRQIPAEQPQLLEQVLAYIEERLAQPITLADTARHFWVSESTVSQTFRHQMGVSFYRCVTQRRLIAAKSLILQDVPLGEINEQVGFADYSTFYRAFRQAFGISPRQFRELAAGRARVT